MAPLPPIGAEIKMSGIAINAQLKIRDKLVTVDFRGRMRQRVDVDPEDPHNSVKLRVFGFTFSADLPPDGDSESSRIVILQQTHVDVDPQSRLRVKQNDPPQFEHLTVLPLFQMTIEGPDTAQQELLLVTRSPATLIATLTQFPPKGDQYQLEKPVDLADPDDPDATVVTIKTFPVKMGGL